VVGYSISDFGSEAFIWDDTNGMQGLKDVLNSQGLNLTGWRLTEASAISDDGTTIVGTGKNPLGQTEAWIANIAPIPISGAVWVISPNGGENLSAGATHEIKWTSEGDIENVKIEYSVNSGTGWTEIVASTDNDGSYYWNVPCDLSDESLIRISDVGSEVSDESDSVFSIMDDSAPSLTVSVEKDQLWPHNHHMIDVGFNYEVSDDCDLEPDFIISVTSDEATESALHSGGKKHCPDAQINSSVLLRAERSSSGDGRVYVITVQATDDSGNASSESIPVKVNINKKTEAIDSGQYYDATEIN
jgi:hypothetical protein